MQIEALWNNNGLSNVRQSNSNKNEQSHSFKKSLNPSLRVIGHQFYDLFRNLFIWKHNFNSLRYIINHLDQFFIESPQRIDNLLKLYDDFMSFALDVETGAPFQEVTFDPNYIETVHKLTFTKCKSHGLIKKNNKSLHWTKSHDKLICNWIDTRYSNIYQLTTQIVDQCCVDPQFCLFPASLVSEKIAKFWMIIKYVFHC